MKITHEFEVGRGVEAVWAFFQDVRAVAHCLPGAELVEDKGGGICSGRVGVKMGPLSALFEGDVNITPDHDRRTAVIEGKGVDRRGGSRGQIKVTYLLAECPAGTKVEIDADIHLSGAAAQFGRTGLINEMTARLIKDFVGCLEAKLAAPTPEEALAISNPTHVKGISFFFATLWARIKRLFSRPS